MSCTAPVGRLPLRTLGASYKAATVSAFNHEIGIAAIIAGMFVNSQAQADPASRTAVSSAAVVQPTIIIEGRRNQERYRLPPEFRPPTTRKDHRSSSMDPHLSCRAVGPKGCGIDPLPIVTFKADGSLQIGAAREPQ